MTTLPLMTAPVETDALVPVYKRQPVEFVRGDGVRLYDAEGRGYLDFVSGIAVNAFGYGDVGIRQAIERALDSGIVHLSNLYRTTPGEELARLLVERSFASSVFFCNSGAEANEGAFKFARRWARNVGGAAKHEILAVRGGFHGRLFATLAATDRPQYRIPFRPLVGGIGIVERDIGEIAAALDRETVAAVIVEPVQGEGGVRVLSASFLQELRALTRERGVALIFDEIQCGLGRTGALFAYEHAEVEPDIMTLAKPLAGGLPMGAILVNAGIAAALQPGDHGSTFGGGPLVASVALHVLQRIADPTLLAHVAENGAWLGERLGGMPHRGARVRGMRGVGFMWGIDTMDPAKDVIGRALASGLLLCSAGDHTVRLLPPLIASREELAEGADLLEGVLRHE